MKYSILIFLFILTQNLFSQEIGQNAYYVKQLVEYHVNSHNNARGYKQTKMEIKTKHNDGKLAEVILYQENVPAYDRALAGRTIDFRTRYVMKDDVLDNITTEYFNLSLEELKSITDDNYKVDKYYFTKDFNYYYLIYLNDKRLATQEYRKTDIDLLPKNVLATLEKDFWKFSDPERSHKRKPIEIAAPEYLAPEEGEILVAVIIDRYGKVVDAKNTDKSTMFNELNINSALNAALKSRFYPSLSDNQTKDTITYKFRIQQ